MKINTNIKKDIDLTKNLGGISMNNRDFKIQIINELKNRNVFTQQVSKVELRTRCPFCGDSQKNFNTGHFYLRINPDDNYPIVYNCFKCPAKGILTYSDLESLGIAGDEFKTSIQTLNRTSDKITSNTTIIEDRYFEYELPTSYDNRKLSYLQSRLGVFFSEKDLQNMKVITSFKDFLLLNDINKITCKPGMAKLVERDYIGFLSNNNSYILFRDITDSHEIRWYKYPITEESVGQRIFYSMKSSSDLYSKEDITINLSEGIMDCISICHNLDYNSDNTLNIAVCGKYYNSVLKYLFGIGFIGSNITINIFPDNDHTFDTSLEYYRSALKNYSYLVNKITINYNMKEKDCGVKKENIILQKFKI